MSIKQTINTDIICVKVLLSILTLIKILIKILSIILLANVMFNFQIHLRNISKSQLNKSVYGDTRE